MDEIGALVSSLHEHLEATAHRPLDSDVNHRLGEAEAIAEDIAGGGVDEETIKARVETILELLGTVDGTGDDTADEHVDAARRAGERVLER